MCIVCVVVDIYVVLLLVNAKMRVVDVAVSCCHEDESPLALDLVARDVRLLLSSYMARTHVVRILRMLRSCWYLVLGTTYSALLRVTFSKQSLRYTNK